MQSLIFDVLSDDLMYSLTMADALLLCILIVFMPLASVLERSPAPVRVPQAPSARSVRIRKTAINIMILWTTAGLAIGAWLIRGESPLDFGLMLPTHWTTTVIISWALTIGLLIFYIIGTVRQSPEDAAKIMDMLNKEPGIAAISPADSRDYPLWAGLSVSAGITEELVYRGYLIVLLTPIAGFYGAAALSLICFIIAHAYQNSRGLIGVTGNGCVLTILTLLAESLWPAILLHTAIDLGSGWSILQARTFTKAQQQGTI